MDCARALQAAVADCRQRKQRLAIIGFGSKPDYGRSTDAAVLSTREHAGILDYRPEELVITARAGTALTELDEAVRAQGQLLPFDPPRYGGEGTLGGAIASGLSGPARPWRGSIRDAVLGVELVNGLAERLRFGGSVMKNVAGYDVSRLVTGSHGALGVILSASVRLLPAPAAEETVCWPCDAAEAGELNRCWARLPLPITGTCYVNGALQVRLSGSATAVASAKAAMAVGEPGDPAVWAQVRDCAHPFFATEQPLTRLSLARGCRFADDDALIEWGGCQAWRRGDPVPTPDGASAVTFQRVHGRWTGHGETIDPVIAKYVTRVHHAFDPDAVFSTEVA